jgi:hypothetical protein
MSAPVADLLVPLGTNRFDLFHDAAGESWAWDGTDALRIESSAFADRLSHDFWRSTGRVPSHTALKSAADALRAVANWDGAEIRVGLRIADHEGAMVLDLADAERRVVVVGPEGWSVTTDSPVRFHRPAGMLALPVPSRGGGLGDLADLWPVQGDDLVLVMGWLLGCLNPIGPKPLLDLCGTQGSGKSVLARMLRSLFDQSAVPLQTMPGDLRNLAVMAAHHALLVFDNVSLIPDEMSDALCRLATGGGFEVRKHYTNDELVRFSQIRPVILTGIPEVARQPDLVDRTISVTLPEFRPGTRLTEAELLAAFEEVRPGILGVLLDGVSRALANRGTVPREDPRMLDFATWVEAGSSAFGWEPDRFLDAYLGNRKDTSVGLVEGSLVGQFLVRLAEEGFVGTSAECRDRLALIAGVEVTRQRGWPITPRGMREILRRLKPALAEAGIVVEFFGPIGHDRRRIIRIHKAEDPREEGAPVVAFTKPAGRPSPAEEVAGALRAVGLDESWPAHKAAALAFGKARGDAALAAQALNALGIPSPDASAWTIEKLRGIV